MASLRTKHWRERREDCYGPIFEAVKRMRCFGTIFVPGHRCRGTATAHHEPPISLGGTDLMGLLPVCDELHRQLHGAAGATKADLLEDLGWYVDDIQAVARTYALLGSMAAERTARDMEELAR